MFEPCVYIPCEQGKAPGDRFFCYRHRYAWRRYCILNMISPNEAYTALKVFVDIEMM